MLLCSRKFKKMLKLKYSIGLLFIILSQFSYSQDLRLKNSLTVFAGKSDYIGDHGVTTFDFNKFAAVFGVSYNRRITEKSFLVASFSNGNWSGKYNNSMGSSAGNYFNRGFRNLEVAYRYHFIPAQEKLLSPFLGIGTGLRFVSGAYKANTENSFFTSEKMQMQWVIPVLLGTDIKINDNISLRYQYLLGWTSSDESDDRVDVTNKFKGYENDFYGMHTIGINFYLKDKKPNVNVNKPLVSNDYNKVERFGTLDSDGDGIIDRLDKCPFVYGEMSAKGCPDSDNDGIEDSLDLCPYDKGMPKFKGCPDSDKDGVPDAIDECPELFGKAIFNGCPDSDGDGIEDRLDKCPINSGLKEYNGCPNPNPANSTTSNNRKKNETIDNLTYPISGSNDEDNNLQRPLIFSNKNEAIAFENLANNERIVFNFPFGKYKIISDSSMNSINAMANLLKQDKSINVTVEGHCDEIGLPIYNYNLGLKRAAYVKAILVSKGINPSRISTTSMGSQKPIATSNSLPARRINRRVEFIISHN